MSEPSYAQMKLTFSRGQKEIDNFLVNRGNYDGGRLPIIAEFSKGKNIEKLSEYLKDTFKVEMVFTLIVNKSLLAIQIRAFFWLMAHQQEKMAQ